MRQHEEIISLRWQSRKKHAQYDELANFPIVTEPQNDNRLTLQVSSLPINIIM
ncbi:MAG: hypothetical protein ACFHVJ_02510 [Aestuariibacter sp.]